MNTPKATLTDLNKALKPSPGLCSGCGYIIPMNALDYNQRHLNPFLSMDGEMRSIKCGPVTPLIDKSTPAPQHGG